MRESEKKTKARSEKRERERWRSGERSREGEGRVFYLLGVGIRGRKDDSDDKWTAKIQMLLLYRPRRTARL